MKSDLEILTEALGKRAAKKVLKRVEGIKKSIDERREAINKKRMEVFGWLATLSDDMKAEDYVDVQKLGEILEDVSKIGKSADVSFFKELAPKISKRSKAYLVLRRYLFEFHEKAREVNLETFDLRNMHLGIIVSKYDAPLGDLKAMLSEDDYMLLEKAVEFVKGIKPIIDIEGLKEKITGEFICLDSVEIDKLDEGIEQLNKLYESLSSYDKGVSLKSEDISYYNDTFEGLPEDVKDKFCSWYNDTLEIVVSYYKHLNAIGLETLSAREMILHELQMGKGYKSLYDELISENPDLKDSIKTVQDLHEFYFNGKPKNDSEDKK